MHLIPFAIPRQSWRGVDEVHADDFWVNSLESGAANSLAVRSECLYVPTKADKQRIQAATCFWFIPRHH
jgi:hypothetical protein